MRTTCGIRCEYLYKNDNEMKVHFYSPIVFSREFCDTQDVEEYFNSGMFLVDLEFVSGERITAIQEHDIILNFIDNVTSNTREDSVDTQYFSDNACR